MTSHKLAGKAWEQQDSNGNTGVNPRDLVTGHTSASHHRPLEFACVSLSCSTLNSFERALPGESQGSMEGTDKGSRGGNKCDVVCTPQGIRVNKKNVPPYNKGVLTLCHRWWPDDDRAVFITSECEYDVRECGCDLSTSSYAG